MTRADNNPFKTKSHPLYGEHQFFMAKMGPVNWALTNGRWKAVIGRGLKARNFTSQNQKPILASEPNQGKPTRRLKAGRSVHQ